MATPIYSTRNRETGTIIELYDSKKGPPTNVPAAQNRWVVVCSPHASITSFTKQADAYKAMTKPSGWCRGCSGDTVKEFADAVLDNMKEAAERRADAEKPAIEKPEAFRELSGDELMKANVCARCGGPLVAPNGHWHSTGMPVLNICCSCAGHVEGGVIGS